MALIEFGTEKDLIALVEASPKTVVAVQKVIDRSEEKGEPAAPRTRRRRRRDREDMAA
ncbi:MAG TPA: hypothetical protein VN648_35090 [Candidatus Methylomirabilis sp.]|nr:hypothetical protein [Candidatus Methylomirabilis sp.]